MKTKNSIGILVGSLALVHCAHSVPPTDLMARTEVSVKDVERAETMQTAPLEVRQARENLDRAKKEMEEKNYTMARRLAEQSLADAQLAKSKTEANKTKKIAEDDAKGIETLRQETGRKVPQ